MQVPHRPSDFTAAWLSEALESWESAPPDAVESLTVEDLGMSTGLTSDVFRITPTYRSGRNGPASMIAKVPVEDEVTAALGSALRLHLREYLFYREMAPEVGITVPRVYYADSDSSSGRYVLLLEPAGRIGNENPQHDLSVSEIEHVIDALATMHARWWNSERLKNYSWLISGSNHNYNLAVQRKYQQAWPGIVERLGDRFPNGVLEIGEALSTKVTRLYDHSSTPNVTLTHGTLEPQQIYVRDDSGTPRVMLISWQAIGVRPGPWDLSICLAVGLPVDERRAHETRLLRRYHDALLAAGVRGYQYERALSDYRTGLLRILLIMAITDDNLDLSTPAGRGRVERYTERSVALRDWKCGELVPL